MRKAEEVTKQKEELYKQVVKEITEVYQRHVERVFNSENIFPWVVIYGGFGLSLEEVDDDVEEIKEKYKTTLRVEELEMEESFEKLFSDWRKQAIKRILANIREFGWKYREEDEYSCYYVSPR